MLTSLLNTALLGTAKQPFQPAHDTPAVLQQYWQQLAHATPEDRFYQFSALSHAYYYGGQALAHSHSPDWQAQAPPPRQQPRTHRACHADPTPQNMDSTTQRPVIALRLSTTGTTPLYPTYR